MKVNYDNGHFTEEKIVTFKNFAGQFAFLLWQTGRGPSSRRSRVLSSYTPFRHETPRRKSRGTC